MNTINKFICSSITALVIVTATNESGWAQMHHFPTLDLRQNMLQVADEYGRQQRWTEAVLQYYQYLYRFPSDSLVPLVHFKIAQIYEYLGQIELAERQLRELTDKLPQNSPSNLEARLRLAEFLYRQRRYADCLQFVWQQPEPPFRLITLYALLELGAYAEADSLAQQWQPQFPEGLALITDLHQLVEQPPTLKFYQRLGLMAMSGVLPGSGRIYLQEYWDGALTLAGFAGLLAGTQYILRVLPAMSFWAISGTLVYYSFNLYATYASLGRYELRLVRERGKALVARYPLRDHLGLTDLLGVDLAEKLR